MADLACYIRKLIS
ncbi:uncharacterized protein FTOL_08718 [Fusarium torulosum]|uniref:Uncharacterized protein n=1 Tax=Fusarium torulosum TaxID=33205 RepID=A0AAE8MFR0_9HYPO|nr:uncharacterized protein FTOL_08718 [Fusarium torulosum]